MRFTPRFFAALALGASLSALAQAPAHTAHWGYEGNNGPLNWHKLDEAYKTCADGKEQSPIDIRGAHLDKKLPPIEFHYIAGGVTVVNNGHSIQVNVHPGSYIQVGPDRYDLVQFHFHHPSEEAVKGKLSDLSVHLVHKSADGKLAVVGVRMNEDINTPNALLASIWQHMPKEEGKSEDVSELVNPVGLLPTDHGYWTFPGSLTTPPCSEGVRWFVMEEPMTIGKDQLQTFTRLYKMNTRPLQPIHGRKILANE